VNQIPTLLSVIIIYHKLQALTSFKYIFIGYYFEKEKALQANTRNITRENIFMKNLDALQEELAERRRLLENENSDSPNSNLKKTKTNDRQLDEEETAAELDKLCSDWSIY
jgi:hypothetical protein